MFSGFLKYTGFILRRERIMSLIWIIALVGSAGGIASMYPGLFPDEQAMIAMATTMNNPAMVAMMGPVFGLDALSPALLMAQECLIWFGLTTMIMSIFFVNRYTRADEEQGRNELFAALPVGRLTSGFSTLTMAFVLNLVISLLIAVFLIVLNIEGTNLAGAFVYGLSIGAQGFVFAGITLLCAQLFSTSRGSMGFALALMGLSYVLRIPGDMNDNALSYVSPLGLGLKVEAFYSDNFLPVVLLFGSGLVIAAFALLLNARRDVGEGIFPARKGKSHGSRFLQSPMGLAWRLSRNGFVGWSIAIFCLGASYGAVVGQLDQITQGNDALRQMMEASGSNSLIDGYITLLSAIMSIIISVPLISCVNRFRGEEKHGRLEQVFAKSVSRVNLLGSFVFLTLVQAAGLLFLAVAGMYLAGISANILSFGLLMKSFFSYFPALMVMIGLAAFLVGAVPQLTQLIWVLFAYSFVILYFGRILDLPEIAPKVSPFGNIPQLPVDAFTATPLVILGIIAVGLGIVGLSGIGKRDIGY